jgi:hypothetical protein
VRPPARTAASLPAPISFHAVRGEIESRLAAAGTLSASLAVELGSQWGAVIALPRCAIDDCIVQPSPLHLQGIK